MDNQLTPSDVRAWREIAGMNQDEFGAMLGLSRATVSRMESEDGEVPLWMSFAHEGWRGRNGFAIEDEIRRIARDEIAAFLMPQDIPPFFAVGQIFYRRDFPLRIAEVVQVIRPDGLVATVQISQGDRLLSTRNVEHVRFTQNWALAGQAVD